MKKQRFTRVYIDAFAGTGYRERKNAPAAIDPSLFNEELIELASPASQRFLDGSAKIALKVEPPFDRFLFIERHKAKVKELERLKLDFQARADAIEIHAGDANDTIVNLCNRWHKREMRGVLFLDPFGMQADWATLEAIASTRSIDIWILFPFAPNRLMMKSPDEIPPGWRSSLDRMFGTKDWETQFYKQKTRINIFNDDETVIEKSLTLRGLGSYYNGRLKTVFPVVAPNPRVLYSDKNRPLFQLFFAAGNAGKGGQIALDIASHILEHM